MTLGLDQFQSFGPLVEVLKEREIDIKVNDIALIWRNV